MRSLLIAPADEQRLAEALNSGADAIIVDLAQGAPAEKGGGAGCGGAVPKRGARPARRADAHRQGQCRSIRARPTPISTR